MTKTIRPDVGLCSANPNDLQIKADLISETSWLLSAGHLIDFGYITLQNLLILILDGNFSKLVIRYEKDDCLLLKDVLWQFWTLPTNSNDFYSH